MLSVSVVIVTYQAESVIRVCLDSLLASDQPPEEIIVVDNASCDGTRKILREYACRRLRVIESAENLGFCGGVNLGIKHATGALVMLLNDDAALPPDALTRLRRAAADHPEAGGFAFRILVGAGPDATDHEIDAAGIRLDPFLRPRDRFRNREASAGSLVPGFVLAGCGAAIAWRRSCVDALERVSGVAFLDPTFFMDKEDADVGWRANLLGARVLYQPQLVAYHLGGWLGSASAPGTERRAATWRGRIARARIPAFRRLHAYRNRFAMLAKNASFDQLGLARVLGLVLYELAALAYVLLRERVLLSAYAEATRRLRHWLRQRRLILHASRNSDRVFTARLLREGFVPLTEVR